MNSTKIDFDLISDDKGKLTLVALGASSAVLASSTASYANAPEGVTSAVTNINSTMTALGGLASAALAVVLIPLGIKYGLGFAKQVMSKG